MPKIPLQTKKFDAPCVKNLLDDLFLWYTSLCNRTHPFRDSHLSLSTRGGDLHGKKESKEEGSEEGCSEKEEESFKEEEIVFHKSSRTGGFSF